MSVSPVVRTLARQIPAVDELVRQRDALLQEVARLRDNASRHDEPADSKREADEAPWAELNQLAERYYGTDGNRKPPVYLAEYERLLSPLRNRPIRLLELGVHDGASMQVWRDYLPHATIIGVDIADKPRSFPSESRVQFVQGSQDDPATLAEAARLAGGAFDVIIDDASHLGYLTVRSFAYLFRHALAPAGLYFIEDICTSFLPAYAPEGVEYAAPPLTIAVTGQKEFPSFQTGMVGIVKQVFDHMMAPTITGQYSPFAVSKMIAVTNLAIFEKAG